MKMRIQSVLTSVMAVGLMLSVIEGECAWAQSSTPRKETWVTNGTVHAIVATTDTVYLGGEFTYVGPITGNGVPIDRASGQPVATFPQVQVNGEVLIGNVQSSVSDGAGGWYIGGDFTQVGGVARKHIAHILADGTVDPAWDPDVRGHSGTETVSAIAVSGSTVYAGGQFETIDGQSRNNIAALDASTGLLTDWNPDANRSVETLSVSGSTVYAGGYFSNIGGQNRNRIAALDAITGNATTWDPNATGNFNRVSALVVSGSTVYAGGRFTNIGGQARNNIAALDAATGNATAWDPNSSFTVRAIAVSGSTVYAGGRFTSIGGQTRNRIAALDAATGLATAWDPNATTALFLGSSDVNALAVSGSTVYAGGKFTRIGGQTRNRIAALDAATGNATAWDPNANSWVFSLAVSESTVYVGGFFNSIGGQTRNGIAAMDAATGNASAWNPNASGGFPNSIVFALAVSGSTVYAGGKFTSIGGQNRNRIAALDAATGNATDWNPNPNGISVSALTVSGSTVYAGGDFTNIGGQERNGIAALDPSTGLATAWDPKANNFPPSSVGALAVSGSTVYAGGFFTSIGGQDRNRIAALDATTGVATAWNPNPNGGVGTLVVSGSTVYVGGSFTNIGGQDRNRIAALNVATGNATAWNPDANFSVRALTVSGSTVYAGGEFSTIGGVRRGEIAALDATTGAARAWNPDVCCGSVEAIAVSGSTLYAGGNFTIIGGNVRQGFAQFDFEPTASGTEDLLTLLQQFRGGNADFKDLFIFSQNWADNEVTITPTPSN